MSEDETAGVEIEEHWMWKCQGMERRWLPVPELH